MNQKFLLGLLIIFVVILGFFYRQVNSAKSQLKTFNFVLKNSQYQPETVTAKLGDTLVFNIDNQDNETHGLHLPEFGIAESIPALQKSSFQFTANKAGSLSTVCNTGHPEKINLIIKP